jgi:hypothetical protein
VFLITAMLLGADQRRSRLGSAIDAPQSEGALG